MRSLLIALLLLPRIAVADVTSPMDLLAPAPPLDPISLCFELKTRPFVDEEARALQQKIDALPPGSEKVNLLADQMLMFTEVALGDARFIPPAIDMTRAFTEHYPKSQYADRALSSLGLLQMRAQQPADARETFTRLIKTYPMGPFYPDVFVIFGDFYFAEGEWTQALPFYEKVGTYWPRGRCAPYARYRSGVAYFEMHDAKRALEIECSLLSDGNRSGPLGVAIRRTLVEAYAQVGDPKKARPFFQRAAGNDADAAAMLRELAMRYRRKSDEVSAKTIEKDLAATSR